MDHSRRKNNECGDLMCVCMRVILFIAAMLGFICAFVVWIIALVDGKILDIPHVCPDNLLWEWLLVWGIGVFIASSGCCLSLRRDSETSVCKNICVSVILFAGNLVVCWWGRKELARDDGCIERNYDDTTFYRVAAIIWWFDFAFVSLATIVVAFAFTWSFMYLIVMNYKCGRLCLNKMSALTNRSNYNNTSIIFGENEEFDIKEPLSYSDEETATSYSV